MGQRDWSKGMQSDLAPAEGARSSTGADLYPRTVNTPAKRKFNNEEKQYSRVRAALLDVVLARLLLAPRHRDDALGVERRDHVFPLGDDLKAGLVRLLCAVEHVLLDRLEQRRDGGGDVAEGEGGLQAGVAADGERLVLLEVGGSELETERDTLWRNEVSERSLKCIWR